MLSSLSKLRSRLIIGKSNSYIGKSQLKYSTEFETQNDDSKSKEEQSQDSKSEQSKFQKYLFPGFIISGTVLTSLSLYNFGKPLIDEDGNAIEDQFSTMLSPVSNLMRGFQNFKDFCQTIQDPVSEKLLPDVHPIYHPMTLVIESNNILLHPEWSYKTGWKFKKRPGLDIFLDAVSPFFEVVIFTNESAMNIHQILMQIDPDFQKIHYRLYKDATRYRRGVHIKDLNNLNRDLSKVIRIDWDKHACQMQPRNTLLLKKWDGDNNDTSLIDLASFLRMMVSNNMTDVRDGLDYYAKFEDPLAEFRLRCEDLKEHFNKLEENKVKKIQTNNLSKIVSKLKR